MPDIYTAKGGETWDMIAFKAWGEETLMCHLISSNPDLSQITVFSGGEQIILPELPEERDTSSLPPWRL